MLSEMKLATRRTTVNGTQGQVVPMTLPARDTRRGSRTVRILFLLNPGIHRNRVLWAMIISDRGGRKMTRTTALLVLLVAAALEAGGDAIVRIGLQANVLWQRAAMFALGAIVLFAYGWTVNAPPWDFGKLIGVYIVFFFLIAQLISWLIFKHTPSLAVLIGGTLIVAGGVVISTAKA
jgi:uncharacterized membrane protein